MGNNITTIGSWAFQETSIKTITIPANTQFLEREFFFNCSKLENVIFKTDKLEKIGNLCFCNCVDIDFVVEGESDKITVTQIGEQNPFCGVRKKHTSKLYYSSNNALLQDYSFEITDSDSTNDLR